MRGGEGAGVVGLGRETGRASGSVCVWVWEPVKEWRCGEAHE